MRMRAMSMAAAFVVGCSTPIATPEEGQQAPDFELSASDGATYTLSQFRGKQSVVIAFFPKAFTGG